MELDIYSIKFFGKKFKKIKNSIFVKSNSVQSALLHTSRLAYLRTSLQSLWNNSASHMQSSGSIQSPYSHQRHYIEHNFNCLETNLITINSTKYKEINLWNYQKKKKKSWNNANKNDMEKHNLTLLCRWCIWLWEY